MGIVRFLLNSGERNEPVLLLIKVSKISIMGFVDNGLLIVVNEKLVLMAKITTVLHVKDDLITFQILAFLWSVKIS